MSEWGWDDRRRRGGRSYLPRGLRPLVKVVPWVTVGLLFMIIYLVGGAFTKASGALFALPETEVSDVADADAVALLLVTPQGTLVFFDDTRYLLEDESQMLQFSEALSEKMAGRDGRTLLALADMRIRGGNLFRFAAVAKRSGVERVLFAEKKGDGKFE